MGDKESKDSKELHRKRYLFEMIIESVTKIKDKKDSFAVSFDDGTEIKVSAAQIADFGIHSGRELSEGEYAELLDSLSLSSSKARALRMLGSRNLSAREIEKRLVGKGESRETAGKTVEWLEEIGMVDDAAYAASIVSHYAGKAYGKARIRDELYRRGIDRELWDEAMSGIDGADGSGGAGGAGAAGGYAGADAAGVADGAGEAGGAVYSLIDKKLKGSRDRDDLRRAIDMLCRRGFSYEEAREAIKRYLEESEA